MSDQWAEGRKNRALIVVDDFSGECPGLEVDTLLRGTRVVWLIA